MWPRRLNWSWLWLGLRLFLDHIVNRFVIIILQLRPPRSRSWWPSMCSSLLRIGLVNRSHIAEFSLQKFEQIEALGTHHQKCNKYDSQVFGF